MTNTPEPADFFLGRGPAAEYLGSVLTSGAPEDIEAWELFQNLDDENYTAKDFVDEVRELRHDIPPAWPWPYASSSETPWAYAYDAGTVYVYRYGVEMAAIRCNYTRDGRDGVREPRRPQSTIPPFPAMRDVASV
jgi:hypothetical protein